MLVLYLAFSNQTNQLRKHWASRRSHAETSRHLGSVLARLLVRTLGQYSRGRRESFLKVIAELAARSLTILPQKS